MMGRDADRIGRRLALHLRKNHFEGCHNILDQLEKDLLDVKPLTAVAELRISLRLINLLESNGYIYLKDMEHTNVFQLNRDLFGLGFSETRVVGKAVSDAFREINGVVPAVYESTDCLEEGPDCASD